jgi:hypothetical protein
MKLSIQWHATADISGNVQVFALVDGRFAFIESALGNNRERQLCLQHFRFIAPGTAMARNGGLTLVYWLGGQRAAIKS